MEEFEPKYLNPFTDFGFRKLFGSEPNKDLLIDFLNALLPERHQIKDLTYHDTVWPGQTAQDRDAVFDLYCISRSGEHFIVEMQKAEQNYFKDRTVFYASYPIQQQGKRAKRWNYKLNAVYLVGILDFIFDDDPQDNEVCHTVQLKDQHNRVFYDKLTLIYLEMPKFTKTEAELKTAFDKWLYVLQCLPDLQARPRKLQERVFGKLFKVAEIEKLDRQERAAYEHSVKVYRDLINVMDTARRKSRAQALKEGMKREKLKTARKLIQKDMPLRFIAVVTGLSQSGIKALQK
jgi:predicted transposase/invertase (TIGR01784 family)